MFWLFRIHTRPPNNGRGPRSHVCNCDRTQANPLVPTSASTPVHVLGCRLSPERSSRGRAATPAALAWLVLVPPRAQRRTRWWRRWASVPSKPCSNTRRHSPRPALAYVREGRGRNEGGIGQGFPIYWRLLMLDESLCRCDECTYRTLPSISLPALLLFPLENLRVASGQLLYCARTSFSSIPPFWPLPLLPL